jgi:hypothetical protein
MVPQRRGLTHGSTGGQMEEVRKLAALPAELTLKQLSAGGVSEKRDDWTASARTHARAVLEEMRPDSIVYVADLDARADLADEIREVRALFDLIDMNIMLLGVAPVPTASFNFSVGSVDRILEAAGADALLIVGGTDEIFTTDRKVLSVISLVASAALTGQAVMPSSGEAHISAGLIARDGTILWWNFLGDAEIGDLRKPEGVEATIRRLLGSTPAAAVPVPVEAAPAAIGAGA